MTELFGVIVNPRSGYVTKHGVNATCALIEEAVPHPRIHVLSAGDDVTKCCRDLLSTGATIVVAAGGDGTVNGVAAALLRSEATLGVLPAGTLNHFARDIGLVRGMRQALQALRTNRVQTIDVGTVNDSLFLNNSSIGLYPHLIEVRERIEKQQGRGLATVEAAVLVAQQGDRSRVSFTAATGTQTIHGSFLFVGNNRYQPDTRHRRFRPRLDEAFLWCLFLDEPGPANGTFKGIPPHSDRAVGESRPQVLTSPQLTVSLARADTTPVSADGEVHVLDAPLEYRIHARALRVLVPE